MIVDVLGGIVTAISDVTLSVVTPILHVPTYMIGTLFNAGIAPFVPMINAINWVMIAFAGLAQQLLLLLTWLPAWLYVPIIAVLVMRMIITVTAIVTKIVDTALLRGWL